MILGLYAFRHRFKAKRLGQINDRFYDHVAIRLGLQLCHEGLINLERIEGETLQVTERRVARPEVIHTDLKAQSPEFTDQT